MFSAKAIESPATLTKALENDWVYNKVDRILKDEAVLRDVFNEFIQYVSNLGGEGIQKGCFWLIFKKSKISSILFFCCILGTFRSSWKRSSTIVLWAVALCPALRGMVFQSA